MHSSYNSVLNTRGLYSLKCKCGMGGTHCRGTLEAEQIPEALACYMIPRDACTTVEEHVIHSLLRSCQILMAERTQAADTARGPVCSVTASLMCMMLQPGADASTNMQGSM